MFDMNHQIAGGQRRGVAQEILGLATAFRAPDQPVPQHVLFGNHRQRPGRLPVRGEALLQRPDGKAQRAGLIGQVAQVGDGLGALDPFVRDQPRQTFARPFRETGDHHSARGLQAADVIGQRLEHIILGHPIGLVHAESIGDQMVTCQALRGGSARIGSARVPRCSAHERGLA